MAGFVSIHIILMVMFPLIINAESLQGAIAIEQYSTYIYNVTEPSKYVLQNIGRVSVTVITNVGSRSDLLKPCQNMELNFISNCGPFNSTNFIILNLDLNKRAIIYVSNLNKEYIQETDEDYDEIKVLEKTFTLRDKNMRNKCNTLDTLISYFWPADKDNVWKQIFDVIKVLLNETEHKKISQWIESDIKLVKNDLDFLNNMIKAYEPDSRYEKYFQILDVVSTDFIVDPIFLIDNTMLHFYILPLYNNFISLKMILIEIVVSNPTTFNLLKMHPRRLKNIATNILRNPDIGAFHYIHKMQEMVIDKKYDTVYAPHLYNVMMNARSYLAQHGLELIVIWEQILNNILGWRINCEDRRIEAISFSNYYGRATPNLLQQAIHVNVSLLNAHSAQNHGKAAELISISFKITEGIVCGLKLKFSSYFSSTLGTFEMENDKNVSTLDLSGRKIFQLKVYKTKFIKCLEFTLSVGKISIYGDCQDNSEEYEKFESKDHYINSLYLANDYTETDTYFDNVAVSYLPIIFI